MTGLFGRAADRDREDFEREVMPHLTEIYRAALRSTRNPAEAYARAHADLPRSRWVGYRAGSLPNG